MKSIFVLAIASLVATGASAQMSTPKGAVAAKPMMAAGPAKPAMAAAPAKPAKMAMKAAPSGRMATATLKNGKKVTYDCSKKGNMTKAACKG